MSLFRMAVFACAVGFFLQSEAKAEPIVLERLEASANSSLILLSDVKKFRDTLKLRGQLDPLFSGTPLAAKGERVTDTEIVEFLIDEKIILQAFPITDAEVEQEINSIQSNNNIDRAQLKSALNEQGFAFEEYFELIRASVSKRNLIDRDIRTKVTISDEDVRNHYVNRVAPGATIPYIYQIQVISVSPKNYKTPGAALDIARGALKAIRGGESFEEVAKRASDHASASAGGDLGEVTEDLMQPVMRDQVRKLQVGQVSEIFAATGNAAYYVLKLLNKRSGNDERFDREKEKIRAMLATGEYAHQIQLWLERQKQGAFIHRAGEPAVAGLPQR